MIECTYTKIILDSTRFRDEYPSSPSCPTGEQNGSLENQPYRGVLDM